MTTQNPTINETALARAANEARGLAMDAVHTCSSGHLGLPLGCAEIGAVLFGHALSYNPARPKWLNRDRFVLSAGHGSMFLYGWLHLAGYAVTLDDIKKFRVLHSKTPGHPEFHWTEGVEATTGPLGQGIANAVGYAVSAKMAEARYNTPEHKIFDHHVVCLAGDGCMQEGVAMEALGFAGHFKLDNLILLYDSNDVTLDAMAAATQSENTQKRFEAIEWDVQQVDGHDMTAFLAAYEKAKAASGKPQLIICKTLIGKGIPEVAGTAKAHGEGGAKFIESARKGLALPEEHFFVSQETRDFFAEHGKQLTARYNDWVKSFEAWQKAHPEKDKELQLALKGEPPADLLSQVPEFPADSKIATRKAGQEVLQPLAAAVPWLISGSADLHGSTLNYISASQDWGPDSWSGRNIRFGIREHGMCGILNGIAYDGLFRASGATFLVFADYCRGSIRLAALSGLPTLYIFTHDSVGVGEDGPTHQPVETVSALRLVPNLDVIRPADPEEVAGAFAAALTRLEGPTLLSLTRQAVPMLNDASAQQRREGVARGAYIILREKGDLKTILLASGSEVQHAVAAARTLGEGVRVVSVPSFYRFDQQDAKYREAVLPASCTRRVAIEAGATGLWWKYVGLQGKVVGIDRFGMSSPGDKVMKELGISADHLVEVVKSLA
ncbi:MAG: transketolase [Candidatus Eremiobacteraeota bacterium]|nr:transketolase [Candidatus Eremiobacteraeota bacterium]MCW5868108.1 transketolase [Candidatus Eremiobacteraeota bacterium]